MCHMLAVAPPMSETTPVQPGTSFKLSISRRTDASLREAADVLAVGQPPGDLEDRLLAHAVDEDVTGAVDQDRMPHPIAPVVVVGEPPQRRLDAADDDRHIRKELLELAGVDRGGVVRP